MSIDCYNQCHQCYSSSQVDATKLKINWLKLQSSRKIFGIGAKNCVRVCSLYIYFEPNPQLVPWEIFKSWLSSCDMICTTKMGWNCFLWFESFKIKFTKNCRKARIEIYGTLKCWITVTGSACGFHIIFQSLIEEISRDIKMEEEVVKVSLFFLTILYTGWPKKKPRPMFDLRYLGSRSNKRLDKKTKSKFGSLSCNHVLWYQNASTQNKWSGFNEEGMGIVLHLPENEIIFQNMLWSIFLQLHNYKEKIFPCKAQLQLV